MQDIPQRSVYGINGDWHDLLVLLADAPRVDELVDVGRERRVSPLARVLHAVGELAPLRLDGRHVLGDTLLAEDLAAAEITRAAVLERDDGQPRERARERARALVSVGLFGLVCAEPWTQLLGLLLDLQREVDAPAVVTPLPLLELLLRFGVPLAEFTRCAAAQIVDGHATMPRGEHQRLVAVERRGQRVCGAGVDGIVH